MFVILASLIILGAAGAEISVIRNLIGEPDYRKVKLQWETEGVLPQAFQVRYCELQSWGLQRCRTKAVEEPEGNQIESNRELRSYATDIEGLRMATTYSFEIGPAKESQGREDRSDGIDKNENMIVIPTKGFSARATQCLPHASEIEVATGPYFGGRIAVEAADGERCALDGEANSPRDTYTLRINHSECGSKVNETTVATFVLVQENLPILTHSTRRFLVLCSYQPETLTVRAGLNLPTHGRHELGHASVASEEETNYTRKSRNMRTARILETPEALVGYEVQEQRTTKDSTVPIALIVGLMVAGIIGLIAAAVRWNLRNMPKDLDNVSVSSLSSIESSSTAADVEMGNENNASSHNAANTQKA